MKKISKTARFEKNYKKLIQNNSKLQKRIKERVELFLKERSNPVLRDHSLKGSKLGSRSFRISGDIRIIYFEYEHVIVFVNIGTHNQVY